MQAKRHMMGQPQPSDGTISDVTRVQNDHIRAVALRLVGEHNESPIIFCIVIKHVD